MNIRTLILRLIGALVLGQGPSLYSINDAQQVALERPDMIRIAKKRERIHAVLKRTDLVQKGSYIVGGAVGTALIIYLISSFMSDSSPAVNQNSAFTGSGGARPDEHNRHHCHYEEYLRIRQEENSFGGIIKKSVSRGFEYAFYSSVVAIVIGLVGVLEGSLFEQIKLLMGKDQAWFFDCLKNRIMKHALMLMEEVNNYWDEVGRLVDDKQQELLINYRSTIAAPVVTSFNLLVNDMEEFMALCLEVVARGSVKQLDVITHIDQCLADQVVHLDTTASMLEDILNREQYDNIVQQAHTNRMMVRRLAMQADQWMNTVFRALSN